MEYVSLIIAEHLAHDVIAKLGDIGTVQFVDVRESAPTLLLVTCLQLVSSPCAVLYFPPQTLTPLPARSSTAT